MPDVLDVFNDNAFTAASLSIAINKIPYQPEFLTSLGLIQGQGKGISTTFTQAEYKMGRLTLLFNRARGADTNVTLTAKRDKIQVANAHLPESRNLFATDIQNVVNFGGNTVQNLASYIAENQQEMLQNQQTTIEHHMIGMVNGIVLDADGTTEIVNWFTEFGVSRTNLNVNTATAGAVDTLADTIVRSTGDIAGGRQPSGIMCLCGNQLFDNIRNSADVTATYHSTMEFGRTSYVYSSFFWKGITWVNYRGTVGSAFQATTKGAAFPMGPGFFERTNAPADYMQAANRPGLPSYSSMERMKHDKGMELEMQTNPLFVANYPTALLEVTDTTP